MIINIPNTLSLINLCCGCLAVVSLMEDFPRWVFGWLALALIADLLDGAAARWLKAESAVGKELDALADMVSFGFFPGFLLFVMLRESDAADALAFLGFLITVFSAVRLARFNTDERQQYTFYGLPSPANTLWMLGIYWNFLWGGNQWGEWMQYPAFLVVSILLSCFLLVADIPMFALKFRHYRWKGNEIKFAFMLVSLLLFAIFGGGSIYWIICIYLLLSLLNYYFKLFET